MKKIFCVRHNKIHTSPWGWQHKTWYTDEGKISGWGCNDSPTKSHEFTTDSIREQRKQYRKHIVQPWRDGEISKEYLDAYPRAKEGMIKEGILTPQQAEKAKPVWHNDDIQ